MTRTVPLPLDVAETKIQPSLERENANGWLGFEMEDTASNSETRLFSLLSPVNKTAAPAASARAQVTIMNEAIRLARILDVNTGDRAIVPPYSIANRFHSANESGLLTSIIHGISLQSL